MIFIIIIIIIIIISIIIISIIIIIINIIKSTNEVKIIYNLNTSYFQCSIDRLCKNKSLFRRFPLSLFRLCLWFIRLTSHTFVRLQDKNSRSGPRFEIKKCYWNINILKQI